MDFGEKIKTALKSKNGPTGPFSQYTDFGIKTQQYCKMDLEILQENFGPKGLAFLTHFLANVWSLQFGLQFHFRTCFVETAVLINPNTFVKSPSS